MSQRALQGAPSSFPQRRLRLTYTNAGSFPSRLYCSARSAMASHHRPGSFSSGRSRSPPGGRKPRPEESAGVLPRLRGVRSAGSPADGRPGHPGTPRLRGRLPGLCLRRHSVVSRVAVCPVSAFYEDRSRPPPNRATFRGAGGQDFNVRVSGTQFGSCHHSHWGSRDAPGRAPRAAKPGTAPLACLGDACGLTPDGPSHPAAKHVAAASSLRFAACAEAEPPGTGVLWRSSFLFSEPPVHSSS